MCVVAPLLYARCHCQSDWITQFALFLAPAREKWREVIELVARTAGNQRTLCKQNIMQNVIYLARSGGDDGGGGSQRPATQFFNQYPIDARARSLCR